MKNRLESILVDCLCDTLNVMLCSESSGTICTINSFVSRNPLFNFIKARSADSTHKYINQIPIWHCLVIDSRSTYTEDFFQIIQDVPYWIPIILLTESLTNGYMAAHSMSKNDDGCIVIKQKSQCINNKLITGEKVIVTCPINSFKQLFSLLQQLCICRKLLIKLPDGLVHKAVQILFDKNPLSVEEWSSKMQSTPRKFQRLFKNFTKYSPKKLLTLYHAYRIAFSTIQRYEGFEQGVISAYIIDDRVKNRVMEYVLTRRSQLLSP